MVVVVVVTEQSIPNFPESHEHLPVLVSHLPALLQFAGQVNSAKKNIVDLKIMFKLKCLIKSLNR
jgi:hypothetical protein